MTSVHAARLKASITFKVCDGEFWMPRETVVAEGDSVSLSLDASGDESEFFVVQSGLPDVESAPAGDLEGWLIQREDSLMLVSQELRNEGDKPAEGAIVKIQELTTKTDSEGRFAFERVESKQATISFELEGLQLDQEILVVPNQMTSLGNERLSHQDAYELFFKKAEHEGWIGSNGQVYARFIKRLIPLLKPCDTLVLYLAGHGVISDDEKPGGAVIFVDSETGSLGAPNILLPLLKLPACHLLVVVDSCFSGSMVSKNGNSNFEEKADAFLPDHVQALFVSSTDLKTAAQFRKVPLSFEFSSLSLVENTKNAGGLFTLALIAAGLGKKPISLNAFSKGVANLVGQKGTAANAQGASMFMLPAKLPCLPVAPPTVSGNESEPNNQEGTANDLEDSSDNEGEKIANKAITLQPGVIFDRKLESTFENLSIIHLHDANTNELAVGEPNAEVSLGQGDRGMLLIKPTEIQTWLEPINTVPFSGLE